MQSLRDESTRAAAVDLLRQVANTPSARQSLVAVMQEALQDPTLRQIATEAATETLHQVWCLTPTVSGSLLCSLCSGCCPV